MFCAWKIITTNSELFSYISQYDQYSDGIQCNCHNKINATSVEFWSFVTFSISWKYKTPLEIRYELLILSSNHIHLCLKQKDVFGISLLQAIGISICFNTIIPGRRPSGSWFWFPVYFVFSTLLHLLNEFDISKF